MAESEQRTLTGEQADEDRLPDRPELPDAHGDARRARPRTLLWCASCDEWLLRSERHAHPDGPLVDAETVADAVAALGETDYAPAAPTDEPVTVSVSDEYDTTVDVSVQPPEGETKDDDSPGSMGPMKVGGVYTVTLSYSVDYRLKVPAFNDSDAERRAKELRLSENVRPSDRIHVHTETREVEEIYEDEVDEYDELDY